MDSDVGSLIDGPGLDTETRATWRFSAVIRHPRGRLSDRPGRKPICPMSSRPASRRAAFVLIINPDWLRAPASAPLANNSRFAASVSAHGQLLAQARVTLRERSDHLVGLLDRPIVTRRYFPQLSAGRPETPAVDELVRCILENVVITNIWVGEGALAFPETCGEELDILASIKVGRGVRFSFSYSITDCKTVADLAV